MTTSIKLGNSIKSFDGTTGFSIWKTQIENLLKAHDLSEFILFPRHIIIDRIIELYGDDTDTATLCKEAQAAKKKSNTTTELIRSYLSIPLQMTTSEPATIKNIILSLSSNIKEEIEDEDSILVQKMKRFFPKEDISPIDLWTYLNRQYGKSQVIELHARNLNKYWESDKMNMVDGQDVNQHIALVVGLAAKLNATKVQEYNKNNDAVIEKIKATLPKHPSEWSSIPRLINADKRTALLCNTEFTTELAMQPIREFRTELYEKGERFNVPVDMSIITDIEQHEGSSSTMAGATAKIGSSALDPIALLAENNSLRAQLSARAPGDKNSTQGVPLKQLTPEQRTAIAREKKITCNNCSKIGHFSRDCKNKKPVTSPAAVPTTALVAPSTACPTVHDHSSPSSLPSTAVPTVLSPTQCAISENSTNVVEEWALASWADIRDLDDTETTDDAVVSEESSPNATADTDTNAQSEPQLLNSQDLYRMPFLIDINAPEDPTLCWDCEIDTLTIEQQSLVRSYIDDGLPPASAYATGIHTHAIANCLYTFRGPAWMSGMEFDNRLEYMRSIEGRMARTVQARSDTCPHGFPKRSGVQTPREIFHPEFDSAREIPATHDLCLSSVGSAPIVTPANQPDSKHLIVLDSGCTSHIFMSSEAFPHGHSPPGQLQPHEVHVGKKGSRVQVQGVGTAVIRLIDTNTRLTFEGALFCPDITHNLLSVSNATSKGISITFARETVTAVDTTGNTIFTTQKNGSLYTLAFDYGQPSISSALASLSLNSPSVETPMLRRALDLHLATSHTSWRTLSLLAFDQTEVNSATWTRLIKTAQHHQCYVCSLAKSTNVSNLPRNSTTTIDNSEKNIGPLSEVIHVDIAGPWPPSISASRFFVVCVHTPTGNVFTRAISAKSLALQHVIDVCQLIKVQHNRVVQIVRSGGEREFSSHLANTWMASHGIVHQVTARDSPYQNGVAERCIRTLKQMIRASLIQAQLPVSFWAEALNHATTIKNIMPYKNGPSPQELLSSIRCATFKHLAPFGCLGMAHLVDGNGPSAHHSQAARFLNANLKLDGQLIRYRCFNVATQRVIHPHTVKWSTRHFTDSTSMSNSLNNIDPQIVELQLQDDVVIQDCVQSSTAPIGQASHRHHNYRHTLLEDPTFDSDNYTHDTNIEPTPSQLATHNQKVINKIDQVLKQSAGTNAGESNLPSYQPLINVSSSASHASTFHDPRHDASSMMSTDNDDTVNASSVVDYDDNDPSSPSILQDQSRTIVPTKSGRTRWQEVPFWHNSYGNAHIAFALHSSNSTPSTRGGTYDTYECNIVDPVSVEAAKRLPDWNKWEEAIVDELSSIQANNTYDLVPRPSGVKILKSKFVLKYKLNPDLSIERWKARLVVKGFMQRNGIDYDDTFAPVVKASAVRLLLFIMATKDYPIAKQTDIKTAFLNGKLVEDVYMEQPEGYVTPGKENYVWKLKRALYGLKQAPRCWNIELNTFLVKDLRMTQLTTDNCLYILKFEGHTLMCAVFVDDILVICSDENMYKKWIESLELRYVSNTKELSFYLGLVVTRNRSTRTVTLSQESYLVQTIGEFNLESSSRKVATPMSTSTVLKKANEIQLTPQERRNASRLPYHQAIGSMSHAAQYTRPDIAFSVSRLSSFLSAPTEQHWEAAKRLLRYINGSSHYSLHLGGYDSNTHGIHLSAWCDSNWAGGGDDEDRRSTSGFVIQLGPSGLGGSTISWGAHKQQTIALSTCEAEYTAASRSTQEIQYLRMLLAELGISEPGPSVLYSDNAAAVQLSSNPVQHSRAKHIAIRQHHIRDNVQRHLVRLLKVDGEDNKADGFTKPLDIAKHAKFVACVGLK